MIELARTTICANSWHVDDESEAMWRMYGRQEDGLAIGVAPLVFPSARFPLPKVRSRTRLHARPVCAQLPVANPRRNWVCCPWHALRFALLATSLYCTRKT
jgi:hypothetical protein